MKKNQELDTSLPLRHSLTLIYAFSLVIALLTATATVAGLLYRTAIYPTDDLLQSFVPTDVTILFIGLPMLLGSMWLTWRGKLIGLLLWPGALLFVLYNYIVYVLAMPLNVAFLLHLALVAMSVYALIGLIASFDGKAVRQGLVGAVPERLAGGVLAGLGLLFFLRAIGVLVNALINQTPITELELALQTSDSLISPTWIVCGVLLWRRKEFGYVAGLGLLFQASMLFIGLIIFLLLQPFLTAAPLALIDIAVVFVMGLICFIPFALYVRGVVSGCNSSPSCASARSLSDGTMKSMRTNLLDTIVRTENLFPQLFADVEKRDWGVLFVTPTIPDSHYGNHACVLDPCCDPVAAVDEIVAFYAERGLTPRVNYLAATDSPSLRKALEGAGFTFGDGDTMQVYVYEGPSRIAANPKVRVRRIETVDPTTFSALRAIGDLRSAKVIERCARRADTWLFVGEIDGQVSSVALLERLGSICRVDEVATAEQYRRKGCARAVIHTLVDYYEKHLSDPMYVWTDNPVAERIYAEAGFAKINHSLISWHAWRDQAETRTVERERSHVFG